MQDKKIIISIRVRNIQKTKTKFEGKFVISYSKALENPEENIFKYLE